MKKACPERSRGAFTLIEILLAIFVLEIGLLGIAGFYTYSFKITKTARMETTAANLASGLLDEQLANAYDNIAVGSGDRTPYSPDENDPFHTFDKKIDVTYVDVNLVEQTTDTHMKKIVVMIYWQVEGADKSFQTASIKAQH